MFIQAVSDFLKRKSFIRNNKTKLYYTYTLYVYEEQSYRTFCISLAFQHILYLNFFEHVLYILYFFPNGYRMNILYNNNRTYLNNMVLLLNIDDIEKSVWGVFFCNESITHLIQ